MQFYVDTELSPRQALTPEGFLICREVPIARVGVQFYHQSEIPDVADDGQGYIAVQRDPSEVFHPDSMRSFEGKPIVDDHPFEAVTPENWRDLAIGHVANPRRGTGANADVLLADLVFTAKRGIQLVRGGKRQVSVGYQADYTQTTPGNARQHTIRANHVALVSEARCGPRCSIGDALTRKDIEMPTLRTGTMADVLKDLRGINASLKKLDRRGSIRDQEEPKRKRLGPPGSFRIVDDDRGCWLVQEGERVPLELGEGAQSGVRPPSSTAELMNAAGPLPLTEGMMGDRALARHAAATRARDAGAAWAAKQNERARQRWGC